MGCKQSTTKSQVAQVETKPATQAQPAAQPAMPQCNFCKKVIPDKLYNAHTVMCDEREVVCWNSWCREIIKQGTLSLHMEQCAKLQRALCSKCGENVLATELQAHRDGCQLIACTHCHEKVIARIVTYCPMNMLGKIEISSGPFATEMLRAKYLNKDPDSPLATLHHNIAKMQLLLRWGKARTFMEESIFWLIHKEMDLKKRVLLFSRRTTNSLILIKFKHQRDPGLCFRPLKLQPQRQTTTFQQAPTHPLPSTTSNG